MDKNAMSPHDVEVEEEEVEVRTLIFRYHSEHNEHNHATTNLWHLKHLGRGSRSRRR